VLFRRPTRIARHSYVGAGRYHVRTGTWDRQPHLANAAVAEAAREQLLRCAPQFGFEVLAYCLMPDHAHVLVDAFARGADLSRFVSSWKQATGFAHARARAQRLWQPGFFERVLRREEATATVAAYIVANPVRAGLATRVGEYRYAWAKDARNAELKPCPTGGSEESEQG
jgi:REP element-mobilizing transposase RayT